MRWPWKGSPRRPDEPAKDLSRDREPVPTATNPSRKATKGDITQLSMRGDAEIIQRFKRICETHGRRTYLEMLVILMDHYEGPESR